MTRSPSPFEPTRRYRAFISYSHSADRQLAPILQSRLMRAAKPWYRLRNFLVFRDQTDLSASPHLWTSVQAALEQSDFFILLASRASAASGWVDREIRWWLSHRHADTLLIALTDGALEWDDAKADFGHAASSALPPALVGAFDQEPLYVDLRPAAASAPHGLRHDADFSDAVLTLAAALHGVPKSTLQSAEKKAHRNALALAWSAAGAITIAAGIAAWMAVVAEQRRAEAERNLLLALARQLSAEAVAIRDTEFDLALLLAVQATWIAERIGSEAESAAVEATSRLLDVLESHPSLVAYLRPEPGATAPCALGPNGDVMAYVADGARVGLYDIAQRRTLRHLSPDGVRRIEALAFSPDGRQLALGDDRGAVHVAGMLAEPDWRVFEPPTGAAEDRIVDIEFARDGRTIATIQNDRGEIRLWPLDGSSPPSRIADAHGGAELMDIAFGAGSTLASAGGDGRIRLWQTRRPGEAGPVTLPVTYGSARAVAFSSDGDLLATAGEFADRPMHLWHVTATGVATIVPTHQRSLLRGVQTLAFDTVGQRFIAGDRAGRIGYLATDLAAADLDLLWVHRGAVRDIGLAPSERRMLSTALSHAAWIHSRAFDPARNEILLWDLASEHRLARDVAPGPWQASVVAFDRLLEALGGGAPSPLVRDGARWFASGGGHGGVAAGGFSGQLAFAPDKELLAYSHCLDWDAGNCRRQSISLGELASTRTIATIELAEGRQLSLMALSPDGRLLLTVFTDRELRLWDLIDPAAPASVPVPLPDEVSILSIAFEPSGRRAAIGDARGGLFLLDLTAPAAPRITASNPRAHANAVAGLAFHRERPLLVSSGYDQRVHLWRLADDPGLAAPEVMTGPSELLQDVAIAPGGDLVAAVSGDGDVWLWDLVSRRLFASALRVPDTRIGKVAFRPTDGALISLGWKDGRVRIIEWAIDLAGLRRRACSIANRPLSEAEWQRYLGTSQRTLDSNRVPRACNPSPGAAGSSAVGHPAGGAARDG